MLTTNNQIWYEKYRPQRVDDMVLPPGIIQKLKEFLEKPYHLMLCSLTPGTGKTSTVNALVKEGQFEALFINASLDNGIDTLRSKIVQFASTESINGKDKIVIWDECLEENERVVILKNNIEVPIRIGDLRPGKVYDCISFNKDNYTIEKDTCEVIIDREAELYEVELEDGRKIKVTSNHPFMVKKDGKIQDISLDLSLIHI